MHLILIVISLLKENLRQKGHLQVDGGRALVHLATLHVEEQAVVLASILAGKVDQRQLRNKIVYSGNMSMISLPNSSVFAVFDQYDLNQCHIEWTAKLNLMTHDR